ncbi:hypothetical protein V1227_24920 [Lentzea sp. DG1S-22]|uniref:hypothetical protein n=1 Tax=Lentzea sp. DG1S-22 TaxID=3108822 RepID=UPI002E78F7CD|nr:hypothetical protein [Lentzea sp. DG1S-22]WVH78313.1 hypothetical protein V1227_24920 [Lentzea sp. DG1S-22]
MIPDDSDLIAEFGKVSRLMPGVLFDFIMGTLTPERQHEFGEILIMLGELLIKNAEDREQLGQPTTVEAADSPPPQVAGTVEPLPPVRDQQSSGTD